MESSDDIKDAIDKVNKIYEKVMKSSVMEVVEGDTDVISYRANLDTLKKKVDKFGLNGKDEKEKLDKYKTVLLKKVDKLDSILADLQNTTGEDTSTVFSDIRKEMLSAANG